MELHSVHINHLRVRASFHARKRAFTLPEGLIATALVAVSVAALAGTLDAVYKQERYIADDARALASARQLMEEVSAMPISASTAGDATLSSMNNYNDTVTLTSTSDSPVQKDLSREIMADETMIKTMPPEPEMIPASTSKETLAPAMEQDVITSVSNRPIIVKRSVSILSNSVPVSGQTIASTKLAQIDVSVTLPDGRTIKVRRLVADADKAGGSK